MARERANATVRVDSLRDFFGKMLLMSASGHARMQRLSKMKMFHSHKSKLVLILISCSHLEREIVKEIKPVFYENYDNLDRNEKYEMVFKKSLELIEFAKRHRVDNYMEYTYLIG